MSIEPPRDKWQPTMHLRWNLGGKLQQMWWREVDEYSTFWKRTLWKPEYEWRDIPTEQPTQETSVPLREFEHASKGWYEYPIGTIAKQSWTGCQWTKTERGWKAGANGNTFPIPGGADQVLLPETATSNREQAL